MQTIPRPLEKPAPVLLPPVIRAALPDIPARVLPGLPPEVWEQRRVEREDRLSEVEKRRRETPSA